MTHIEDEHGGHLSPDDHGAGIHLPDPSIWPLTGGAAALLLGLGLVWWSGNPDNWFTGPLMGAALFSALLAAGGWAYEDGRMKRKAELGEHTGPRAARYTQVITFAIAEGQLGEARSDGGVLTAVERATAALGDMAGFQDLRVVASAGESGPSQVLVETTWAGREELTSYEESRQTLLDLLTAHDGEVLAGSVQAFDMEVVRDTKDVAFRFSMAAAVTTLAALAIGGLALAAGLSLFQEEGTATAGEDGPVDAGPFTGTIVAQGTRFRTRAFSLPPATDITLTLDNRDRSVGHNIVFFNTQIDGPKLAGCASGCEQGDVLGTAVELGPATQTFTFKTPAPGTYQYNCEIHPKQMTGTMTVAEGALLPGQAPAAASPASGTPSTGTPASGTPAASPTTAR